MEDEQLVNKKSAEASEPEEKRSSKVREIDLFLDGVLEIFDKLDLDEMFNEFGLVTSICHQRKNRFCFVTLLTTEMMALKACQAVTGYTQAGIYYISIITKSLF